jgi:hypothetical protein
LVGFFLLVRFGFNGEANKKFLVGFFLKSLRPWHVYMARL